MSSILSNNFTPKSDLIAWDVINSEGKTVAMCVSSIGLSNKQMITNPLLQQTVNRCSTLYLEIEPDRMEDNKTINSWVKDKSIIILKGLGVKGPITRAEHWGDWKSGQFEMITCLKHYDRKEWLDDSPRKTELEWLAQLLPELKESKGKPIAICVDVSHFVGEYGLLEQFKEAGYKVSRIMTPVPDHSKIGKFFKKSKL